MSKRKKPPGTPSQKIEAKKSNKIAIWSLIITIVLFGINSFFDYFKYKADVIRDEQLTELTYQINAVKLRPHVKFIGDPQVELTDSIRYSKDNNEHTFLVDLRWRLVNVGNAIGHTIGGIVARTPSDHEFLRDSLDRSLSLMADYSRELPVFSPGDTVTIGDTLEFSNSSDTLITLHFFILYRNEFDAVFDTYYRATFERRPTQIGTLWPKPGYFQFFSRKSWFLESFQLVDAKTKFPTTKLYDRITSQRILNAFKANSVHDKPNLGQKPSLH